MWKRIMEYRLAKNIEEPVLLHRLDIIYYALEIYRINLLILGTSPSSLMLINIRLFFCFYTST